MLDDSNVCRVAVVVVALAILCRRPVWPLYHSCFISTFLVDSRPGHMRVDENTLYRPSIARKRHHKSHHKPMSRRPNPSGIFH